MICVANKIDLLDGKDYQPQRELWLNWCLDCGFELIECSAIRDEAEGTFNRQKVVWRITWSFKLILGFYTAGADSEESEGISRLIEALGSHTWASLQV